MFDQFVREELPAVMRGDMATYHRRIQLVSHEGLDLLLGNLPGVARGRQALT